MLVGPALFVMQTINTYYGKSPSENVSLIFAKSSAAQEGQTAGDKEQS